MSRCASAAPITTSTKVDPIVAYMDTYPLTVGVRKKLDDIYAIAVKAQNKFTYEHIM